MQRAVGYVRVSAEGGRGDDLISPDIQLAAIRDHCQRSGYRLVNVLTDIDRTGRKWARRQAELIVGAIEAGDADVAVVWKVSRLARNRRDWAVAVDRVEVAGGRLESATEPNDTTTSSGRFARGMLAELAAFESDRIGEGWRETHQARVRAGLTPTGKVPWPWRHDGRTLTITPEGAAVIRELYAKHAAGQGFKALADYLTAAGYPTVRGGVWSMTTVKSIMDHPVHAGLVSLAGVEHPGAHEAVIDEATRAAYLAQRRDPRRKGRRQSTPYLLSGLLVCGQLVDGGPCGHRWAGAGGGSQPGRPRYRCDHAARTGVHVAASVPAAVVEGEVMGWLAEIADELNARVDSAPVIEAGPSRSQVEGQVNALENRLAKLTVGWAEGLVPDDAYRAARDSIEAQRAAVTAALAALQDAAAMTATAPLAADLLAEWDSLDIVARRAALRALIRQVTIRSVPDVDITVEALWSPRRQR